MKLTILQSRTDDFEIFPDAMACFLQLQDFSELIYGLDRKRRRNIVNSLDLYPVKLKRQKD